MKVGIYTALVATLRGYERNVSGHVQLPMHTIHLLREAGHDVSLITTPFGENYVLPACAPADVPIHEVVDARRRIRVEKGHPHGRIMPSRVLQQMQQLKRITREHDLDVLHFFGFIGSAQIAAFARTLGVTTPNVVTLFGGGSLEHRSAMLLKMMWRRIDAVATATEFVQSQCERAGVHAHLVRHGLVRDLRSELPPGTVTAPRHRVLFWRDATTYNGADITLEAYRQLAPAFPEVSFDFAIRPAHKEVPGLDEAAAQHENVHLYRFPYPEGVNVPQLVAESLIIVLPFALLSVNPQLVILESLAAGVPVVATRLGSIPEMIEPGVNGELVPVGDAPALTHALRTMLNDRERLQCMREQCIPHVERTWNWSTYAAQLTKIYEQVAR